MKKLNGRIAFGVLKTARSHLFRVQSRIRRGKPGKNGPETAVNSISGDYEKWERSSVLTSAPRTR
ncbi:MAG: hypothetical protein VB131_06770, partial [Burkholderia gladioli]